MFSKQFTTEKYTHVVKCPAIVYCIRRVSINKEIPRIAPPEKVETTYISTSRDPHNACVDTTYARTHVR